MKKKKTNEYFEGFVVNMEYACKAAEYLEEVLKHFDPELLDDQLLEMHKIEHDADLSKHSLMQKLAKEFITPIEREDIILLLQQIDNVIDLVEDVVIKMYMYNASNIREEALEFACIIKQCCYESRDALKELPGFQKSHGKLADAIVKVNDYEEQGDRLYCAAMRRLYRENAEPLERITWTKLFDWMEACCDACEDVMESVELVVLKNS